MDLFAEDEAPRQSSALGVLKAVLIYGFMALATHQISPLIAPALVCLAYFIDNLKSSKANHNILRIIIGLVLYVIIVTALPFLLIVLPTDLIFIVYDWGPIGAYILWFLPVLFAGIILAFTFPNPQFRKPDGIRTMFFWSFIVALALGVIGLLILGLIVGFVSHTGI